MELQILHWFGSLHNPITDPIMYAFTCMGDAGILWIALALASLIILPKRYRKVGLTMVIALIFSVIMCNGIMKNVYHRTRPFVADPTLEATQLYGIFAGIHDWSFPSGHTSASFAAALAIFMWYKREGICAIVVAALIAISRLYLTVHYPTDVLVSLVLGSLYGVLAYFVAKWLFKKFENMHRIFIEEQPYRRTNK